jgi:hypothetical protein
MKKKPSAPPTIPASSPEALQKARIALGEKPPTRMEEIEADKKFIAEMPKQVRSKAQLEKYFEEEATKLLKQEEERKRWTPQRESSGEDDAPEMIYSLESCDYEEGDELGEEEAPQASATDNGDTETKKIVPPWMKPGYDNNADEKIRFQYHQFDPGLKRGGTTTARSLPDHIWTALQAVVGPMPAEVSSNTPVNFATFAQSVAGDSDEEENTGKETLGFHLDRSYRTLNATSREVTPENAWVFSEERLQDFIVRLMDDAKIAIYEKDPDNPTGVAQLFKRALKAWFNLYFFYRVHTSDLSFTEMEGLQVPKGLWTLGADNTDVAARKMHRKRLLRDGIALYGSPPDWKPLDEASIERSKKLWPLFERIRHQVVKPK